MKKIIPTILILFLLINCASMQDEEKPSSKKILSTPPKRVLITPEEYLIIKKIWQGEEPNFADSPQTNIIFPMHDPRQRKRDYVWYIRGTRDQQNKGFLEVKKRAGDNEESIGYWTLLVFGTCRNSEYCKDVLVDKDNDGVIDYISLPKNSDGMLCINYVNSDGTSKSVECALSDNESRTIKKTIDEFGNGNPDTFIYFDPQKETKTNRCITKVDYDTNNNGRLDKWDYYENCKRVRTEIDENENGTKETITYYNQKGEYDRSWSIGGDNEKKANAALEAKKYDEAIGFYQAANQELSKEWGADSDEVCVNLNQIGRAYTTAQQFPDAIKIFNQGLALKKCKDWAYAGLSEGLLWAYAYSENHKMIIKSGINAAKQYAKTNDGKKNSDIEGLLGYGYYKEKDYSEAYKHSLSSVEINIQNQTEFCKGEKQCSYMNPWYFSIFGNACSQLNKSAESLAYYKKALEFRSQLNSEQFNSFEFSFAYQSYIAGDPKKAISMNERFLNDKDKKKYALTNHAFFHLALNDLQKANQFIKTAVTDGLKKDEWDEDIEFFKTYYPKQASLLPEFLKASGQY